MNKPVFKIVIRTALFCMLAIVFYEAANQLLIYRYLKFDYYLFIVALIALATGLFITRKRNRDATGFQPPSGFSDLTNKELHILLLISEGKSNKEIAAMNFVEVSTIKTHINNLYGKLRVNNRKQAIEIYRQYPLNHKSTFSPPSAI